MQNAGVNSVVLVIGGVRSGKSKYAQQLAEQSKRVTFVATAERRDDPEMQRKIDRHRAERPACWTTLEEPLELGRAICDAGPDSDVVLIDCLTLFGANLMATYEMDEDRLKAVVDDLCASLAKAPCSVILVSNEVGSGVVPAYALGRRFRDVIGEINQRVAAAADSVVLMVAGLPLALKGSLSGPLDGGQR